MPSPSPLPSGACCCAVTPAPELRASLLSVQKLCRTAERGTLLHRVHPVHSLLVVYCEAGDGLLELAGVRHTLHPGDLALVDGAAVPHSLMASAPWRALCVQCAGDDIAPYLALFRAHASGPVVPAGDEAPEILSALFALYEGTPPSLAADIRAAGLLAQLLSLACTAALAQQADAGQALAQQAVELLSQNYARHITLDELAKALCINKYSAQKIFKRCTGLSPNDYLLLLRINHAKNLLCATDLSIRAIAARVGVDNVSHFISLFRRHEGCTPGVYRQLQGRC